MFSRFSVMVLGLAAFAGQGTTIALAAQTTGLELARANNCLGCHQVDKKRVGPPFAAIAERFAPIAGAQEHLATVIRSGSRGSWGAVPMPAQTQVSQSDAQFLADWILSLSRPEAQAQAIAEPAPRNER